MNKFSTLVTEAERLVELRDVPVTGWESLKELIFWLTEDLHYERLGAGSYTITYGKGDYVVKIQRPTMTTPVPMKCAIRFHRMALKANNPHLPKVYFVRVYKDENGAYKYVFGTERLYELSQQIDPSTLNLPKDPMQAAVFVAFLNQYIRGIYPDDALRLINKFIGPIDTANYDDDVDRLYDLATQWDKLNHPLVTAYLQVKKILDDDNQCFDDFAERNIMQRKDGTIVINDPIADHY